MKTILSIVAIVIILPIFLIGVGWHYETGNGEHTGFITAVEKTGIFFKTNTIYLKTDTQSSQEDQYCVVDQEVFNKLKEYVTNKQHVNVYYVSWFTNGVAYCRGDHDVIYRVEPLVLPN